MFHQSLNSWSERCERHPVYLTSLYFVELVVQFVFVDYWRVPQIPSNVWLEEWVLRLASIQTLFFGSSGAHDWSAAWNLNHWTSGSKLLQSTAAIGGLLLHSRAFWDLELVVVHFALTLLQHLSKHNMESKSEDPKFAKPKIKYKMWTNVFHMRQFPKVRKQSSPTSIFFLVLRMLAAKKRICLCSSRFSFKARKPVAGCYRHWVALNLSPSIAHKL